MSSSKSPCAACKLQRRKCTKECVFAPYFPPDQPQKFANVHKVFGASNVAKLLNDLNVVQREDAVNSLVYEADANLHDPVYGCVGLISILQHRLKQIQVDLINAKKELANYVGPSAMSPIIQHPGFVQQQQHPSNPAAIMPYNTQPMLGQHVVMRDQQQQMQEAQQVAVVAREQQELMRSYEQQPVLVRFNETGGAQVTRSCFNNNQLSGSGQAMSLALGSYQENPYQIQQQSQDYQAQQLQVHPQLLLQQQQPQAQHPHQQQTQAQQQSQDHQLQLHPQLIFTQQQQNQAHKSRVVTPQQQHNSAGEEGRIAGPSR